MQLIVLFVLLPAGFGGIRIQIPDMLVNDIHQLEFPILIVIFIDDAVGEFPEFFGLFGIHRVGKTKG